MQIVIFGLDPNIYFLVIQALKDCRVTPGNDISYFLTASILVSFLRRGIL